MSSEPIYRVEIEAATLADLKAFVDEVQPDVGCRAVARQKGDAVAMDVYVPEAQLHAARSARSANRVSLRVLENATETGRERQEEVGKANRFAARGETPRGLGRKE
jgi:dihydroxyacetone kinase